MKKKNGGVVAEDPEQAEHVEQEPAVDEIADVKRRVATHLAGIEEAKLALDLLEGAAFKDISKLVELAPNSDFRFGDQLIRFRCARNGSGWSIVDLNKRQVV